MKCLATNWAVCSLAEVIDFFLLLFCLWGVMVLNAQHDKFVIHVHMFGLANRQKKVRQDD